MLHPLFDLSPLTAVPLDVSLVSFAEPHRSRLAGDCDKTGLLCTLRPGETARRLIEYSSRSSSRRRLLDFFSPSAAVKGARGCGVDDRDTDPGCTNPSAVAAFARDADREETPGESMLISSLTAEDPARGNDGGGVWAGVSRCQKPRPLLFLGCPNAANRPFVVELSRLMPLSLSSSGTPSSGPSKPGTVGKRFGDDCAVTGSASLSRT